MARYKCKLCGKWLEDVSLAISYKDGKVHSECFNREIALIKTRNDKEDEEKKKAAKKSKNSRKPKAEVALPVTEEEYAAKKAYFDYLRTLIDEMNAKIYVLTDKYISQYGFNYAGMRKTLVYLHEIVEKEVTSDVVGLIPYYYDDAQKYYNDINALALSNKCDMSDMYHVDTVYINPHRKAGRIIDMTLIGGDEE